MSLARPQVPMDPTTQTAYSLLLLSEYTHTLDSLPIDLSRNFADLREIDGVLSSSMTSITSKIHTLIAMIEENKASKEDKLWLLTEISEEASRLKIGGEDKIRVACQAADNLKGHATHLRELAGRIPEFPLNTLNRRTVYPHVSPLSFMPVHTLEHGRRRRNVMGSLLTQNSNNADPSPAKRKRVTRDEDIDIGQIKSPRKERVEATGRGRANNRVKKTTERGASPTESVLSANNFNRQVSQSKSTVGNSRTTNGNASGGKRRGGAAAGNRNQTPLANEHNPAYDPRAPSTSNGYAGVQQNGTRRDAYAIGSASANNMGAYQNGVHQHLMQAYDMHNISHIQNWNPTNGQPLEGPGMPVSRTTTAGAHVVAGTATPLTTDNGLLEPDVDGEADDTRYCFCNGVSYGEMIACDDDSCEREWFHLACTGLSAPPSGKWYCDDCKSKRNAKRAGRGGKRRAAGGRASAKA